MKLCILGATGPLGLLLVEQSLQRGHSVRAFVRNQSNLEKLKTENLEIIVGNPLDPKELESAIDSCDAVLSALGARVTWMAEINLLTNAGPVIVDAMRAKGVKRLIICTAMYTTDHPDQPFFIRWIFKPLVVGRNMDDFRRLEIYLQNECKDIDYTVVKPPGLTNGPMVDCKMKVEEGDWIPNGRMNTPRANVAGFMLDCLDTTDWIQKQISVSIQ